MEAELRVILRPVEQADLDELFEQQRDPESVRMALVSPREREDFLAHWAKILADKEVTLRSIVASGQLVGHLVCWSVEGDWTVGYWLARTAWGKGIATEALRLFLNLITFRPLWARVATHNNASLRVLEKCGFVMHHEESFTLRTGETGRGFVLRLE